MELATMGRVLVKAKAENIEDLVRLKFGYIPAEQVREVEIADALVDTGAYYLSLPSALIRRLGLTPVSQRRVRTTVGPVDIQTYSAVRLTIQDRSCTVDVAEVPDGCPTLIGQIPLEILDFVVDPKGQRLIGNPEHGGEWMLDMF